MMIKNKNKYKMLNIIWKHKAIKRINKTRILYLNNKKNKKNKNSKNSKNLKFILIFLKG